MIACHQTTDARRLTLTREQGKPLAEARREVAGAAFQMAYFADLEIPEQIVQDDEQIFSRAACSPRGSAPRVRRRGAQARLCAPIDLSEPRRALAARAETVVVGDGMDPATTMGPLNNAGQRDRVASPGDSRASLTYISSIGRSTEASDNTAGRRLLWHRSPGDIAARI